MIVGRYLWQGQDFPNMLGKENFTKSTVLAATGKHVRRI
jgi:hypothetical protein